MRMELLFGASLIVGAVGFLSSSAQAGPGDPCTQVDRIYEVETPAGPSTICDGAILQTLESAKGNPVAKGIGTATPQTALDVNGTLKIDYGSEACDVNREGAIRFVSATNTFSFCADNANDWESVSLGGGASVINDLTDAYTDYGASSNFIMGRTGADVLTTGAQYNVFIGEGAGATSANSTATTDDNIAVGYNALGSLTTGDDNAAFGIRALKENTTGSSNTALGRSSLYSNTAGANNTAVGYNSLYSNVAKSRNTAIGRNAMYYADNTAAASDGNNTAVGYQALYGSSTASNNTGVDNTAIGNYTLLDNTTGSNNTALGVSALENNTTGDYNVALGYNLGTTLTTGDSNILIGHDLDVSAASASNELNIGDVITGDMSTGDIVIGGTAALTVPIGTEAQRPTAVDGMVRYKTDTGTSAIGFEVRETGAWISMGSSVSDKRLKKDIKPLNGEALADLLAKVKTYSYIMKNDDSGRVQYGVLAQELDDVFPELVDGVEDDPDNMMSVRYNGFIAPLIAETQALRAELQALRAEIEALKAK